MRLLVSQIVGQGLAPAVVYGIRDAVGAFINRKAIYRCVAVAGNNAVDRAPTLRPYQFTIFAMVHINQNLY